jgi:predicted negative regulator of RcsB-dependent stress response
MTNNVIKIIITILLILSGVFAFMYFVTNSKLEQAKSKNLKEKKEALRKLSKRKNFEIDSVIKSKNEEYKLLLNLEQEIKYVPYEKLRYVDRDLDAALDVVSDYKYDSSSGKKKK